MAKSRKSNRQGKFQNEINDMINKGNNITEIVDRVNQNTLSERNIAVPPPTIPPENTNRETRDMDGVWGALIHLYIEHIRWIVSRLWKADYYIWCQSEYGMNVSECDSSGGVDLLMLESIYQYKDMPPFCDTADDRMWPLELTGQVDPNWDDPQGPYAWNDYWPSSGQGYWPSMFWVDFKRSWTEAQGQYILPATPSYMMRRYRASIDDWYDVQMAYEMFLRCYLPSYWQREMTSDWDSGLFGMGNNGVFPNVYETYHSNIGSPPSGDCGYGCTKYYDDTGIQIPRRTPDGSKRVPRTTQGHKWQFCAKEIYPRLISYVNSWGSAFPDGNYYIAQIEEDLQLNHGGDLQKTDWPCVEVLPIITGAWGSMFQDYNLEFDIDVGGDPTWNNRRGNYLDWDFGLGYQMLSNQPFTCETNYNYTYSTNYALNDSDPLATGGGPSNFGYGLGECCGLETMGDGENVLGAFYQECQSHCNDDPRCEWVSIPNPDTIFVNNNEVSVQGSCMTRECNMDCSYNINSQDGLNKCNEDPRCELGEGDGGFTCTSRTDLTCNDFDTNGEVGHYILNVCMGTPEQVKQACDVFVGIGDWYDCTGDMAVDGWVDCEPTPTCDDPVFPVMCPDGVCRTSEEACMGMCPPGMIHCPNTGGCAFNINDCVGTPHPVCCDPECAINYPFYMDHGDSGIFGAWMDAGGHHNSFPPSGYEVCPYSWYGSDHYGSLCHVVCCGTQTIPHCAHTFNEDGCPSCCPPIQPGQNTCCEGTIWDDGHGGIKTWQQGGDPNHCCEYPDGCIRPGYDQTYFGGRWPQWTKDDGGNWISDGSNYMHYNPDSMACNVRGPILPFAGWGANEYGDDSNVGDAARWSVTNPPPEFDWNERRSNWECFTISQFDTHGPGSWLGAGCAGPYRNGFCVNERFGGTGESTDAMCLTSNHESNGSFYSNEDWPNVEYDPQEGNFPPHHPGTDPPEGGASLDCAGSYTCDRICERRLVDYEWYVPEGTLQCTSHETLVFGEFWDEGNEQAEFDDVIIGCNSWNYVPWNFTIQSPMGEEVNYFELVPCHEYGLSGQGEVYQWSDNVEMCCLHPGMCHDQIMLNWEDFVHWPYCMATVDSVMNPPELWHLGHPGYAGDLNGFDEYWASIMPEGWWTNTAFLEDYPVFPQKVPPPFLYGPGSNTYCTDLYEFHMSIPEIGWEWTASKRQLFAYQEAADCDNRFNACGLCTNRSEWEHTHQEPWDDAQPHPNSIYTINYDNINNYHESARAECEYHCVRSRCYNYNNEASCESVPNCYWTNPGGFGQCDSTPDNISQGAQYDNCCMSYPEDCSDDEPYGSPLRCKYWNCCENCNTTGGVYTEGNTPYDDYWEELIRTEPPPGTPVFPPFT